MISKSSNQRGMTLIELLASLGIVSMVVLGVVGLISHEMVSTGKARTYVSAANEIVRAASNISRDAMMAENTDLAVSTNSADQVTLTWVEKLEFADQPHYCQYYLDGNHLIRDYDGNLSTVARDISGIAFSQNDRILTVSIICHPPWWNSEDVERTYRVCLRPVVES